MEVGGRVRSKDGGGKGGTEVNEVLVRLLELSRYGNPIFTHNPSREKNREKS